MNFQQLKIIREAARQDYNLTEVANMLYTSQSGVSRHIRELEEELGIEIFIRRGKRLLGMTEPGKALLSIAERILNEASNVRRLADLFTNDASGVLTIATTHTQARYSLPWDATVSIGANNVFDIYPTRRPAGGVFGSNNYFLPYSSLSPFGFNGRFLYTRASIDF